VTVLLAIHQRLQQMICSNLLHDTSSQVSQNMKCVSVMVLLVFHHSGFRA